MAIESSPYVTLRRRNARPHHRTSDDHGPRPARSRTPQTTRAPLQLAQAPSEFATSTSRRLCAVAPRQRAGGRGIGNVQHRRLRVVPRGRAHRVSVCEAGPPSWSPSASPDHGHVAGVASSNRTVRVVGVTTTLSAGSGRRHSTVLKQLEDVAIRVGAGGHQAAATDVVRGLLHWHPRRSPRPAVLTGPARKRRTTTTSGRSR